jgi:hypothetical protein
MRQILIVANQTVGSEALAEAVRTRMAAGPYQFVLLVPASERTEPGAVLETMATTEVGWRAQPPPDAYEAARNRLRGGLGWLHHLGAATAEGEVGDKNPMHAIRTCLEREGRQFDEIIISTLPTHISRWVRMDLPQRAKREFGLPVTAVTASRVTAGPQGPLQGLTRSAE